MSTSVTTAFGRESPSPSEPDRFGRQAAFVPRDRLAGLTATVVGVGAVGRQVALQLASLGVPRLRLVDFDAVEATNVTTQGYPAADVGRPKVMATADAVLGIDPSIRVEPVEDRWRPSQDLGDAVFCCVDSIAARAAVWKAAGRSCRFWCDGRMLGETVRVLTVSDGVGRSHYPTTLFAPEEAQAGRCTARGVISPAAIAAGLMTHQFARRLRGLAVDPDLTLNLLAAELTAAEATAPADAAGVPAA